MGVAARGRRSGVARLCTVAALLLALTVSAAACDDETAIITDAEDIGMVEVEEVLRQPDRSLRKQLTVRGTVTKDIADAGGPNAILLDGLLVIGPQIANDARVGASLEVHGTFHEFHFTEPGAVGGDLGDPHPLEEYDGRPALFTTRVSAIE